MNIGGRLLTKLFKKKARQYVGDKAKGLFLARKATEKASNNKGVLEDILDKLQLLVHLFQSWLKGEYRDISNKSLVLIATGLMYFVVPTDFIPDFILGPGFLDDATVIAFVFNQLSKELDKFSTWKATRKNEDDTIIATIEEEEE